MCIDYSPKYGSMGSPPPVTPRVETPTALPTKKEVVDPNQTAALKYGTSQKKAGPSAGKKTGTDALKINLNLGSQTGSTTGGANVKQGQ